MDHTSYLERIGYSGPIQPTLETLKHLHRQHLFCVPFENLDIHLGRPLSLELPALYDKIVTRRRGGFCYELNGMFAWLLRDLGYRVSMLSARVLGEDGEAGPEFDHMTLLVHLDRPWLADVGFGDGFLEPIGLEAKGRHVENDVEYRIVEFEDDLALDRQIRGEDWTTLYYFTLEAHSIEDYEPMCTFHQTSLQSPFTRKRLCTMATWQGRLTLTEQRFIETTPTRREESLLTGDAEWERVLRDRFAIGLY